MITRPTVLILGAGASSHLGYPTGRTLVNDICALIRSRNCHYCIRERWPEDLLEDFYLRLSRSGYQSIDAFVEADPSVVDMGKMLIADALVKHEDEQKLFPPFGAGWYEYLFDRMFTELADQLPMNRVSIITFNYDRSLEAFLTNRVMYRYSIDEPEALVLLAQIPIIHTYGFLGSYPDFPYSSAANGEDLMKRAESIRTMSEERSSEAFVSALDHLEQAEAIYFLGFGFDPANMDRFGFFCKESLSGKTVLSTCMVSRIEKDRLIDGVSRYGLTSASFPRATDCNGFFRQVATL